MSRPYHLHFLRKIGHIQRGIKCRRQKLRLGQNLILQRKLRGLACGRVCVELIQLDRICLFLPEIAKVWFAPKLVRQSHKFQLSRFKNISTLIFYRLNFYFILNGAVIAYTLYDIHLLPPVRGQSDPDWLKVTWPTPFNPDNSWLCSIQHLL